MAVTQNSYTGNGSTTTYSFTFPYLKASDIKASLDAVATTAFTLPTATTLQFNSAPANGVKIKIFRETATDNLTATFYAGSAIKSEDLNENFTQNLYSTQEVNARYLSNLGGTMIGNFGLGEDADIVFEGATDNTNETTITVADPTADRTITFPDTTGTVVTTGDTGTITSTMLADGTVVAGDLASNSVTTAKIVDSNITTAKIADDAVTGAKIADDQINSEHYVDGSIDTAHIADSQITNAKMADNSVNTAELVDDAVTAAKLASNSVVSASIVDGSIATADIADNAITNAKMADDSVGAAELVDTSVGTAALASNAVTLAKMADNSVGTTELVNDSVTTVKIANSQVTTAKIADSNVTTAKINNDAVTSAKIPDNAIGNEHLQNDSVRTAEIQDSAVTTAKIANSAVTDSKIASNAVTTDKIADAELTTLAGMQSGTASILASSTALTATTTELNQLDGKTIQTTVADNDAQLPTSGAIVDYVAAQIAPLGGLEVIATEVAFPNTQPASGVVISISDAGGIVVNGSGVSTTGRTVGGSTVTINGFPSSLQSSTLAASIGLLVSSTGSSQTYNYHKILGKESDITALSDDINDFNNRYRVSGSAPTSSLDNGDLWFDTANGKMMVYNGTSTAWEEVSAVGSFNINTLSSSGSTGGGSATFNGTAYRFTLSNPPQDAQQLLVSINGVVQKPNSGSSQPSEGFAISGNDIIFGAAPPSGSISFIVTLGQSVQIGTPSDNTISTAKIQNLAVTTDKIADDAVTAAKLANGVIDLSNDTSPQLGGSLDTNGNNINFADNIQAVFGTGSDSAVRFNGTDFVITTAGKIKAYGGSTGFEFYSNDNSDLFAKFIKDGSVELYYDGSKKLETTSTGVAVTGALTVSATAAQTGTFQSNQSATTISIFDTDGDGLNISGGSTYGHRIHTNNTEKLELGVNGSTKLVIDSSGRVLIGHSTGNGEPLFSISGNTQGASGAGQLFLRRGLDTATIGGNIGADLGEIKFGDLDGGTYASILVQTDEATGSNDYPGRIMFKTTANGASSPTEKMRIDSSGNVGIGTTSPAAGSFHIHLTETPELNLMSTQHSQNNNCKLNFGVGQSASVSGNTGARIEMNIPNAGGAMNGELKFFTNSGDNLQERMRILAAGGLTFNGDTAAANALDDYEEGTYTITPLNDGGATLTSNRANYTKIGNMVRISGSFTITATNGTNNNQARFSLPFTSSINSYYVAHGNTITSTGYTGVVLSATIENSAPYMIFNPSVGMASRSWSQLGNNRFDFDVVYRV